MAMTGGTAVLVSKGTPSGWPGPIELYVYWKEKSQSIASNQTVLSLGMYVVTPSGYYIGEWTDWNGSYIGTAASGANCHSFDGSIPQFKGTRWLAENVEVTVNHNSDGTKNAIIYWHWGVNSVWSGVMNNPSGSFSVTLTQIPRASVISSAADLTLGSSCRVQWTPKASSFYYKLVFTLGTLTKTVTGIAPGSTGAYTYTGYAPPVSAAEQIPDDLSGTMKVTLYTCSDSACTRQIGEASTAEFTVNVPVSSDTRPAVSLTPEPVGSLPAAFAGLYIQGKTKVRAEPVAQGKYGASITKRTMSVGGKTYGAAADYTSDYLTQYGTVAVSGSATDSRGISGSTSKNITVIAYSAPKILAPSGESEPVAARCDAQGNRSDSGTYLLIRAKRSYSKVSSGGAQKNFCCLRYRYRLKSAESWSDWSTILAEDASGDEVATDALLGGVLDVKSTYLVQIQAVDTIGETASTTIIVPTEKIHTEKTKNGLGLGKHVEGEELLDVGWDAHFWGEVQINGVSLRDYILAVTSGGG